MSDSQHSSLAARILVVIERHPEGLHLEEVRSRLCQDGHRPSPDAVAIALLDLQRANLTQIGALRRWSPYAIPPPHLTRSAADRDTLESAGSAHLTSGPVLTAIPATVGVPQIAPPAAPPLETGERLEPSFGLLRRLLPYYREALARNERALLLGDAGRYGELFLLLAPRGLWWPGEGECTVLHVARALLPPAFLTALARRGREPLHLAFPIALVHPSDAARPPFVFPVATVAVDWALDAETLRLELSAATPAIEWAWVRGQRQRGRRIREWLDALEVNADDEVWQTGALVDWRTFAERFAGAVPTELRTPLDLIHPLPALDCGGSAGVYGGLALFLSSDLQFARHTVRDLLDLAQWSDAELAQTALAAFFSSATEPEASTAAPLPVLEPLPLGEDQLRAVRDGLNRPLAVVTGPPGTGKSQVAVALMASAALAGRSVLFASRNHQAIDAVVDRFADVVDRHPLLIRANTRDGGEGFSFERAMDAILARPGVSGRRERFAASCRALARLDAARATAIDQAQGAAEQADELGRLETAIGDLETALGLEATAPLPLRNPLPPPEPPAKSGWRRLFTPWRRFWRLRRIRRLGLDWARLGLAEPSAATLALHEQRLDDLRTLQRLREDRAQLTHITQVRPEWEADALRAAGLRVPGIGRFTFSANSLFHFAAAASGDHHLLRDHFRCHDDIADYISETFYGHRLRPLTDARQLRPPPGKTAGFHWTEVLGPIQPARTGCWAPAEIDAILAELGRLLAPGGFAGTIGVVTPFREQANRLRDQVERVLPVDRVADTRLEVHTAHGFQGDARDVMLFSLCVGPEMPERARQFLRETGNLINVAISRARAICHVFGDLDYAAQCGIPYLETLLARRHSPRQAATATQFDSPWEERLWQALAARGIETITQYPIAGRRLDLALIRGDLRLDIEVDGDWFHRDPDGRRKMADLWRDHQLRALGWKVVRFWVYELRENMNGCIERILAEL